MRPARSPSLLIVLLPGLALAALGVRAVSAQVDAARTDVRDRARSVAARLARTVETVVGEHVAALPAPRERLSLAEAITAVAHLHPFWVVDLTGRSLVPPTAEPRGPGAQAADAYANDTLAAARRVAERDGADLAATFVSAAATATTDPLARARLLLVAARYHVESGAPAAALRTLTEVVQDAAPGRDLDGTPLELALLQEAVAAMAAAPPETPAPWWMLQLYEQVASDPWGLADAEREGVLDRVDAVLGARLHPLLRAQRRRWADVRAAARSTAEGRPPPAVALSATGDEITLRLAREIAIDTDGGAVRALVGGDVPAARVATRLVEEARVLAAEEDLHAVRLMAPDGRRAIGSRTPEDPSAPVAPARTAEDLLIETVPLAAPLAGWRAEAVARPPTGLPPSALMLALATIGTTLALAAGAVALRRAAERQAQLAEERRTFLDHVAHEIRSPATAILALSEELSGGDVTPARRADYTTHLLTESRRLATLLEDTLDLARLEAGRLVFDRRPTRLAPVVEDAVRAARERTRSDLEGVVVTLPPEDVVVAADPTSLMRAVAGLVDNALRHGGGASVSVHVETSPAEVAIVVRDHGPGIEPAHLPHVFERFYRAPSATHETKGVGLGLVLCREIARAHGGDVTAASAPGEDTTFRLTLPRTAPDEEAGTDG